MKRTDKPRGKGKPDPAKNKNSAGAPIRLDAIDLPDGYLAEDGDDAASSERLAGAFNNPANALALETLRCGLPKTLRAQVEAGLPVVVLLEVPGQDWVKPIQSAVSQLFDCQPEVVVPRSRPQDERVTVIVDGPVFAVAADPARLDREYLAGADAHIRLKLTPKAVSAALTAIYGASATVRAVDLAGLGWRDLVLALRPGTPRAAIRRLRASTRSQSEAGHSDRTPLLEELAGYGQAMDRLRDIAADLVDSKVEDPSTPLPSIILHGPPGTGKTTLARSLARTVGLPLVATSIGDWFSGSAAHLGTVVAAARSFFDQALASSPCVAFIDELDALPNRAHLDDRNREWWTPLVTTVLVGIDRMRARDSRIVLVGATNHRDRLDGALLRPGRFDLHLEILGPRTAEDVEAVLRHHLNGELAGADLKTFGRAGLAIGATGATLEVWVRAARDEARRAGRALAISDLAAQALPATSLNEEAIKQIALHEAAHAVVGRHFGHAIVAVSIVGRDQSLGQSVFAHNPTLLTRNDIEQFVMVGLAGRAADEFFFGVAAANAQNDLFKATGLLVAAHRCYGLGDTLAARSSIDEFETAITFDATLKALVEDDLQRLMGEARRLVAAYERAIRALAKNLIVARVVDAGQVDAALALVGPLHEAPAAQGSRP